MLLSCRMRSMSYWTVQIQNLTEFEPMTFALLGQCSELVKVSKRMRLLETFKFVIHKKERFSTT